MIVYCVFRKIEEDGNELIAICKDFIRAETMAVGLKEKDMSVPPAHYYVEEWEIF